MMFPKQKRFESEKYLEFVRSLPCCMKIFHFKCGNVSSRKKSDPHHVKSKKSGGSDLTCIPMCRAHHSEIHSQGIISFQAKHKIDLRDIQIDCLQKFIEEELSND